METIKLSQGLLAIRHLIDESVKKDWFIAHYITHLGSMTNKFEITIFANSGNNDPHMLWSYKFIVPYTDLIRVLEIVYKMIAMSEKKGLKLH